MSLEVVYGEVRNRPIAMDLAASLADVVSEGTVYLGYPVLASADERVEVDALLVSESHGLVAFQLGDGSPRAAGDWTRYVDAQDRLFSVLESNLRRHDRLRAGRSLALTIETVTVFAEPVGTPPTGTEGHYTDLGSVGGLVAGFGSVSEDVFHDLQAALQRVTTIKPAKKRGAARTPQSRGSVLKEIEKGIANLDRWQKRAAIETPEGPQRVRGLAGSGKTVVLALKAAYLHAQHPEWRIAVTFQSRSLYEQFEDLITRFSFEHSNDAPDFEQLQILHAWGSSSRAGLYTTLARAANEPVRDWNYGSATFGRDDAFRGVCAELLAATTESDAPVFDAVLIDEAQDLPVEFFRLVHRFTATPKRIVWAFDELQNLSEVAMPPTAELFGVDPDGVPLVSLESKEGEARRDIILPVCYRNTPWSLVTAHALGFGVYKKGGLVQHFDDPTLWRDIGYSVLAGVLEPGEQVELERAPSSYPGYFPKLLKPEDAVVLKAFEDEATHDAWIAEAIQTNLGKDELEHDDILIVLPNTYTSKRRAVRLAQVLARRGIQSHLAGVQTSVDQVFQRGSIAMAHIYRAKGNEAPMVYVVDSQYMVESEYRTVARRNTIFTAITRSRAWVRICGYGSAMPEVAKEVAAVEKANFRLQFKVPTAEVLARLRRIHKDRTEVEVNAIKRARKSLDTLVEALERDEIDIEDLPPKLRTRLANRLRESQDVDDAE